jgi:hypothetical protein
MATRDDKRYVRVYQRIVDDPKFVDVWPDDARLALWLRLLMAADQSWPQPATIPRSVKARPFKALVDCGLVDMVNRDQYRIHGMDTDRIARHEQAQAAVNTRWNARSNTASTAVSNTEAIRLPNTTEHNRRNLEFREVPAGAPSANGRRIRNYAESSPEARALKAKLDAEKAELDEEFRRRNPGL